MKLPSLLILLTVTAAAAEPTVLPEPVRPELVRPAPARVAPARVAPGRIVLALPQLLARALVANPGYLSARESEPVAHGRYQQSLSAALPHITAFSAETHQSIPNVDLGPFGFIGPSAIFAERTRQRHLEVSAPVLNLSAIHGTSAARHARRAAKQDVSKALIDLVFQVKREFYEQLLARRLIAVEEATVKQVERQVELARLQVAVGSAPRIDELRSQVRLANARPGLIQARYDSELSQQRMANLLGLGAHTAIEVEGNFLSVVPTPDVDDTLKRALKNRPDGLAARERLRSARKDLDAARAARLPTVTVVGALDDTFGLGFPIDQDIKRSSATARVDLPIFDGLQTSGRIKIARAQERRAAADLTAIEQAIELDVSQAMSLLARAVAVQEASGAAELQAEQALEIGEEGYKAGLRTYLDLLDAQLQLAQARSNVARARRDYSIAWSQLEQAQGLITGVEAPAPPEAPASERKGTSP